MDDSIRDIGIRETDDTMIEVDIIDGIFSGTSLGEVTGDSGSRMGNLMGESI